MRPLRLKGRWEQLHPTSRSEEHVFLPVISTLQRIHKIMESIRACMLEFGIEPFNTFKEILKCVCFV